MTPIPWQHFLPTGDQAVDQEHAALFQRIVQLDQTWPPAGVLLPSALSELAAVAAQAQEHFRREEIAMLQQAYPGYWRHQSAHRHLERKMSRGCPGGEGEPLTPLTPLLLAQWLGAHIQAEDLPMAEYFRHYRTFKAEQEVVLTAPLQVNFSKIQRYISI